MSEAGNLAYNTVSVPTTAPTVASIAARTSRRSILIQNTDATNPVYIGGDTSVASTTGLKIAAGNSLEIKDHNGPIFLRSTGGTVDCRYLEVY